MRIDGVATNIGNLTVNNFVGAFNNSRVPRQLQLERSGPGRAQFSYPTINPREVEMYSKMIRTAFICLATAALAVLAVSCSNDRSIEPTAPFAAANPQGAERAAVNSGNVVATDPGAPEVGTVVEGQSVPGIALGYTRAQVEAAYGEPQWCQGPEASFCSFPVNGGGQVDIHYRGADGGSAQNSPDDVAFKIRWSEQVSGWVTTAGVNTTLAADNPDAVLAAYPDAVITYNMFGDIYSAIDYQQGIEVFWILDFYSGVTRINMSIFYPTEPPPPPDNLLIVTNIDLTASKVKGKRQIQGFVRVENERGRSISGATVSGHWTFPNGSIQAVENITSSSGNAYFLLYDIPRGTYSLAIDNVELENYTFDMGSSVLSASVYAK
jgi:hypothetical protein